MRRLLGVALCLLSASALAPSAALARPATGRLIVTFEAGTRPASTAASALAAATGARRSGPAIPQLRAVTVRPPRGTTALRAFAERLRARPGVARVEVERRYAPRYVPNDPALTTTETATGAPAGTSLAWWVTRQGLPAAWDVTRGATAKVAVIDQGFDGAHPDLQGRIDAAVDTTGARNALVDPTGHGTHVASLACATGDNGVGIVGAGFGCRLLLYKSDLSDASVAQSIVQATDRGAGAITMSFGSDGSSPPSQTVVDAVRYARDRGAVPVAAAADEPVEEQGDPANIVQPTGTGSDLASNDGLSVTAANFSDQRASFAGKGSQISLAAYGAFGVPGGPRGILGAFPANETELERPTIVPPSPACRCRTSVGGDTRYAYLQGTSMATPMVAAVAALVRDLNPDLTTQETVRVLKETARRPAGTWTGELGWGILDAGAAVAKARTLDRRAPSSRVGAPRTTRARTITVRLRGRDVAPARCVASGVSRYELWRGVDGGALRKVGTTRGARMRVRVTPGRTYRFFSVAIDRAGNREPRPGQADARVRALR